jgi:hypothetical protein
MLFSTVFEELHQEIKLITVLPHDNGANDLMTN